MTNFLTGTNRGLGGLKVEQGSTEVFGVNHIVFTGGATLTDNSNGKVTVAISGGGGGGGMTTWTIAGASGSTVVNDGETVTITGSSGITTAESGRTVSITPTGVLEDLNGLGVATGADLFIVSTGAGVFGYQDASATRTTLGLGTMATQNANAVAITGGSITGITDLAVADGGTGLGSYTVGDILYASGTTTLSKLAIGTAGQVLQVNAGATAPEWVTGGGGGSGTITPAVNFQIPYYSGGGGSATTTVEGDSNFTFQPVVALSFANRFTIADDFIVNADIGSTEKCVIYVNPAGNDVNWAFNSRTFNTGAGTPPAIIYTEGTERQTTNISSTVATFGQTQTAISGAPVAVQAMPYDGTNFGACYVVDAGAVGGLVEIILNVNTDAAGQAILNIGETGYVQGDQISIMTYSPNPADIFNIQVNGVAMLAGGGNAVIAINGVAGADAITNNYTIRTYTLIADPTTGSPVFIAVG